MTLIDAQGNAHARNGQFTYKDNDAAPEGQLATAVATMERKQPGPYTEVERHDWLSRSYTVEVNQATGLTDDELYEMTNHAIIAGLWSTTGDDDQYLDYDYGIHDVSRQARGKIASELARFIADNRDLADAALASSGYSGHDGSDAAAMFAHDFILTRNGHGTGFWDRDALRKDGLGQKLTTAAQHLGPIELYAGDDGRIYA